MKGVVLPLAGDRHPLAGATNTNTTVARGSGAYTAGRCGVNTGTRNAATEIAAIATTVQP